SGASTLSDGTGTARALIMPPAFPKVSSAARGIGRTASFGVNNVSRNGTPRPMKMGTIAALWRYDTATCHAVQSANPRRPARLHYASCAAVFPIWQGGSITPDGGPHDRSRDRRDVPAADMTANSARTV